MLSSFPISLLEPALCRPESMWCDAASRMMARKIFSPFGEIGRKPSFSQLVFNLSTVSVPVFPFQVDAGTMLYLVDAGTMLYLVDSDVNLQTNEDW